MSEKNYKKLVEKLSNEKENSTCIDCSSKQPKWASQYYGVFMCLECAGKHRSLGVGFDSIKSVKLDSWEMKNYLPMKYGGNKRFLDYILTKNIERDENMYRKKQIIDYSVELVKRINEKTGQDLPCATLNIRQVQGKMNEPNKRTVSYEEKISPKISRLRENKIPKSFMSARSLKEFRMPQLNRLRDSFDFSDLTSKITHHARNITNKTVSYSIKLGSSISEKARGFMDSEIFSSGSKKKDEEEKISPIKTRKTKESDWS